MAKLSVESDDFVLEFASGDFGKVIGKARSNVPKTSLVSTYAVEGAPAEVKFDVEQPNTSPEIVLSKGTKSVDQGTPFFFDNVTYGVWLEPKENCGKIVVCHAAKLVENELAHHGKVLHGTINFANEVGRYDFAFSYEKAEHGVTSTRMFVLTFEVLSQKLDYHKDWRSLVEDIEARYPMLAYDYLRRTYHAFEKSNQENDATDLIWWNLFNRLQQPFVKACRLIIARPRRRLRGAEEYRRADQLTVLTPSLENAFAEHRNDPACLYRVERERQTHDTPENRFVKYALNQICRRYCKLHKNLVDRQKPKDAKKLSESALAAMNVMESELRQLVRNPFWRGVGPFMGIRQLSLALQRAPGYSTAYRTHIILNAAYMIHAGVNKMETKDIAELYEIWCFLKVEEFTKDALPVGTRVMTAPGALQRDFVTRLTTGLQSTVVFRSSTGIELARVVYNPEIKDGSPSGYESGIDNTFTPTSIARKNSQDPDIVLRLTNTHLGGDYQLTYLFDAKYRMEDMRGTNAGAPPQDAIDQMHRYRDAIYYGQDINSLDSFSYKKEIIGGYILFPGKNKVDMLPPPAGQQDKRLSYVQSIDKVNIGAIPLRPNDPWNAEALKDFIARLVAGAADAEAVLGRMNPQKGALVPVATVRAITEATVYGTYHGKAQLNWIRHRRYYNLPAAAAKTVGITPNNAGTRKLLALLPPGRNPTEELLVFKIKSFMGIVSKNDLKNPTRPNSLKPYAYPSRLECHHEQYMVWELTDDEPITKRIANIRIISGGQTGVDQGALEAAVELGLDYGGWAPYGWLAEQPSGSIPACYRARMREYPDQGSNAQNYRERTKANVRDSHATLILVDKLPLSGGTKLTENIAVSMMRSHHVVDMSSAHAKEEALIWLRQFLGMSSALVLNVAGPRESKSPGMQMRTRTFLKELLWEA